MVVKAKNGEFLLKNQISEKEIKREIAEEDIVIIFNFFNESYYGVFDEDRFTLGNTLIAVI